MKHRNHRSRWTTADISYVEEQYGKIPTHDIACHLGRSPAAIHSAAGQLGLARQKREWSEAEKDILRTHYARGDGITYVMTLLPGRSRQTIFTMARTLGITSARSWSPDEVRMLRKYYPLLGTLSAGKLPGRTEEAVKIKANELNLRFCGINGHGVRQRMWSAEERRRLAENLHLPTAELVTLFPGRTLLSVKKAKDRLRKKRISP